jgi:hypothetical protein
VSGALQHGAAAKPYTIQAMSQAAAVWIVLLVAFVAANAPFFSERLMLIGPRLAPKGLAWRALELLVLYFLVGGFSLLIEQRLGQIAPQNWEFYVVTLALFLTFAFPGFVWRHLRRANQVSGSAS